MHLGCRTVKHTAMTIYADRAEWLPQIWTYNNTLPYMIVKMATASKHSHRGQKKITFQKSVDNFEIGCKTC